MTHESRNPSAIFDVGINEWLPAPQLVLLGLQNIFGMTGMFVFPGIFGRAFQMSPEEIAYLYGMTFIVCGIITILQSVWLLRLPVVQGPYAGNFAALLTVGHLQAAGRRGGRRLARRRGRRVLRRELAEHGRADVAAPSRHRSRTASAG